MGIGANDMDTFNGMRSKWEFKFPTSEVLGAAKAKLEFFNGRLAWWTEKASDVKASIKEGGIEIDESIAAGMAGSYTNTGRNASVNIRSDLVRDMNECNGKIMEHRNNVKVYDGWVQFLSAATEDRLALSHSDWLFFFGK